MVTLYQLWAETDCRIDSLAKQVREGVAVDEASNFSRWLVRSGVLKILEATDFSKTQLYADVPGLKKKSEQLVADCGDWYAKHERSRTPREAYISVSKLDALEKQIARMAAQLEKLSLHSTETETAVSATAFHVIQGGAS